MRVFAIAGPEEHRQQDETYLNGLRDVGLRADHPVHISESEPYKGGGRFENFRYDEFPELADHSDEIFISAYPGALEQLSENIDLESEPVYLDRYPLDTAGLQQPSTFGIMKDEILSILPGKESSTRVQYSSASEILEAHNLDEVNLKTIDQFLDDREKTSETLQRRA